MADEKTTDTSFADSELRRLIIENCQDLDNFQLELVYCVIGSFLWSQETNEFVTVKANEIRSFFLNETNDYETQNINP